MTSNLFREAQIFDNLIANQLCDELVSALLPEDGTYPYGFLLTGAAAYALQQEYSEPLKNIIFRVTNPEDYIKLLDYIDRISAKELTKYGNRTYFKFPAGVVEICFMIMYDEGYETSSLEYAGIRLEHIDNIKPELL